MALATATEVQKAYLAYFGRPADPVGLTYWQTQELSVMKAGFAASSEYTNLYSGMTDVQRVEQVYQNVFGRSSDAAGLLYWAGRLAAGTDTVLTIADNMMQNALGVDITTINNRVTYANAFTAAIDTSAEIIGYSGTAAAASARTAVSAVTTDASLVTAQASMATSIANVVAAGAATGTSYTLTTAADTITGTSANDTITGTQDVTGVNTIGTTSTTNTADSIDGGGGTDTLNVIYSGASATNTGIPALSIKNVEVVNVRNATGAALTGVDASNISGMTAFNSDRSTGAVTVTNLAAGASAGVIGNSTVVNGAFNAGYVAAATAGVLNIKDGVTAGAVTMTGTGLTSQTVNSTGAANTIGALTLAATTTSLTVDASTALTTGAVTTTGGGASMATINVKGAGAVSFGATALEAGVTTIDASANSGGLTVALGTAVTQTVTGSTGNDVITSGAVLTTGSVNAGTGTDTLNLGTNVAHANTASLAAKYTGFETLRVNGTFDASLIAGITAVEVSGATNNISNLTATQAAAVTGLADIGATTFALKDSTGTSDVLSLTLGNGKGAAFDTGALTINGFETLNVKANPISTDADVTSVIASFTADKLTAINLTGNSVTLTNAATTNAVTIDGSALTGILTIGSSSLANGSTVQGSAGKDVFTAASEGSTWNGNAGNDSFTTTAAILNADGTTDIVLNGGTGTDTLNITGAATLTDVHFTNVSNMETLATAVTTAVSYTGLGAAAKAAFANGLTITSGTLADGATYTVGAGLYDKAVTLTLTSSGDGATTADNIAITTGSGADTVSVTAASWVSTTTAGATGTLVVSTGAGNDAITISTGTLVDATTVTSLTITGGTGADTINLTSVNAASGLTPTFVIAAGDSTTTAYDSITGFDMGTGGLFSSTLDFASVGLTSYAATAATGYTAAQLTVAVSAAGLVTFAGTSAAALTLAEKIAAVQSVVTTNAGDSALFTHGTNSYVFNNNATADSVVELVGITGTSLVTANATTAGAIFIA